MTEVKRQEEGGPARACFFLADREDGGVSDGRKHVPKQRAAVNRSEAVQEHGQGAAPERPRQRPDEGKQNAHGPKRRAGREGDGVRKHLGKGGKRKTRVRRRERVTRCKSALELLGQQKRSQRRRTRRKRGGGVPLNFLSCSKTKYRGDGGQRPEGKPAGEETFRDKVGGPGEPDDAAEAPGQR